MIVVVTGIYHRLSTGRIVIVVARAYRCYRTEIIWHQLMFATAIEEIIYRRREQHYIATGWA